MSDSSRTTSLFPVDLHAHTIASSHAYSTLQEHIAEARNKGLKMFAITDHGPSMPDAPHYWHFVNMRVFPRLVNGIAILRGIEANIVGLEGETDCYGRTRECLDIVLAGFHNPVLPPGSREQNTRAMVNAIRSGTVDIITHPGNTAYPIDIEAVVRAAAESNVALEVNNSSFAHSRKGCEANCRSIIEAARDLGATLSVGSDAHIAYDLGEFSLANAILRETNYPIERLLNSSPRKVLDFLASRGYPEIPEFSGL